MQVLVAKWQILVNENDITNGTTSSIEITPEIDENANIADGTIAPSSKGHFDIVINPENVGVSFDYDITLDVLNENMPDLMITKYSILPKGYVEGDQVDVSPITDNVISETMDLNENKHETFTVRVYFEWFEGTENNETMDDAADTAVAISEDTLNIEARITFKQKLA